MTFGKIRPRCIRKNQDQTCSDREIHEDFDRYRSYNSKPLNLISSNVYFFLTTALEICFRSGEDFEHIVDAGCTIRIGIDVRVGLGEIRVTHVV